MEIKWYGHSCFEITSEDGRVVVTDPFDASVGYQVPEIIADVVTVSHEHFDHNNVGAIKGNPDVVKGAGEHMVKGMRFYGVKTYHDTSKGAERGENTVFLVDIDGMRLCHLGDLGHALEPNQLISIKEKDIDIDVLFIPVGGVFTIDAKGADVVLRQLEPKIAVPMHYKTSPVQLNIKKVDQFIKGKKKVRKEKILSLRKEDLPQATEIVVLDWQH
jgi:L-ascorbate metabolism protein UlaG (beta-lactamase superfamily)